MTTNSYYRRIPQLWDDRTSHISELQQLQRGVQQFRQRTYPFKLIDIPSTSYPQPYTHQDTFRFLRNLFNASTPKMAAAFGLSPETYRRLEKGQTRATYTMTLAVWGLLYQTKLLNPKDPPFRRELPQKLFGQPNLHKAPSEPHRTSLAHAILHAQKIATAPTTPSHYPPIPQKIEWRDNPTSSLEEIRINDLMLTQEQLARVVGLSRTQISNIGQDRAPFLIKTQLAIQCILYEIGHTCPTDPGKQPQGASHLNLYDSSPEEEEEEDSHSPHSEPHEEAEVVKARTPDSVFMRNSSPSSSEEPEPEELTELTPEQEEERAKAALSSLRS